MKIHIVKKGDSLFSIAQKYNVSLEEVLQLNPSITNPDVIEVGMKVKIPTSKPGDMEIMHQHVVKQGDSLWKLSKAWGVPLSDMIKANPQLKNPNVLLTGEVVNIPKASSPSIMPEMNHEHSPHEMTQQGSGQHHPLHPLSMMQGVQGLVGKMSTAPFIGKKPTGQKPLTAPIATSVPTPMPTPLPEPVPTPLPVMPIMQKPVEKYPVHIQYEKHIDLFQQYGVPATEVMSLYEMPKMPEAVSPVTQAPHYGYGYEQPMTSPVSAGGYGYPHVMPTAVSPAQTSPDWCPPEDVAGASNLPWGAPTPMPYGSMLSPAGMEDCGPEWVSPADVGPHGYGGYGYEHRQRCRQQQWVRKATDTVATAMAARQRYLQQRWVRKVTDTVATAMSSRQRYLQQRWVRKVMGTAVMAMSSRQRCLQQQWDRKVTDTAVTAMSSRQRYLQHQWVRKVMGTAVTAMSSRQRYLQQRWDRKVTGTAVTATAADSGVSSSDGSARLRIRQLRL